MNGSYTVEDGSSYGWVYLFQGGRLDTITSDNLSLTREEDPGIGTWMSEDPLGFKEPSNNYFQQLKSLE